MIMRKNRRPYEINPITVKLRSRCVFLFSLLYGFGVFATVRYVDFNSTNALSPYTDWSIAATNIQDAVDASGESDIVLVTNGVYNVGQRDVGDGPSRVAITNRITLVSANGPQLTVIEGSSGRRCVWLSEGASLIGFTLRGASITYQGGGVYCSSSNALLINCIISSNRASLGGGAYGCTLYNCTLATNDTGSPVAGSGGGAYGCTLFDSMVTGNSSLDGGGAYACTLYNCTLTSNYGVSGIGAADCVLQNCTLSSNQCIISLFGAGGGASGCTLYNCTVAGNSGVRYGGGASASTLYNCTLTGNSTAASGVGVLECYGGGVSECTLFNCTVAGNSAGNYGGGAESSVLYNCTLIANRFLDSYTGRCSGAFSCTLSNCIIYFNPDTNGANFEGGTLNYCCTTPLPTDGVGNITNAPLFVDYANGNLRLQSNSPCINAGNNTQASTLTDLDGNPRIVNGTVDIGAYEYQGTGSLISYAWLQQFALPTDGSADFIDSDNDGMNNWQEWHAGTNPTNALSVLKMLPPSNSVAGLTIAWQSVSGIVYFLQRSTNLGLQPTFWSLQSNLVGQVGVTVYADTNAIGAGPFFYRVGVQD
jgi:hypothetical protein